MFQISFIAFFCFFLCNKYSKIRINDSQNIKSPFMDSVTRTNACEKFIITIRLRLWSSQTGWGFIQMTGLHQTTTTNKCCCSKCIKTSSATNVKLNSKHRIEPNCNTTTITRNSKIWIKDVPIQCRSRTKIKKQITTTNHCLSVDWSRNAESGGHLVVLLL